MGYVNIVNITFEENMAPISKPFSMNIQFECLKALKEELEWQFVYVGNSNDSKFDQELDKITMEGADFGYNEFTWEVDPPNYKAVPDEMDVLDSTIIMIMVSYKQRRFFRCSYLIRHFYKDEVLNENLPEHIIWDKLYREIKTEKPIITLYDMVWDETAAGSVGGIRKEQFLGVDMMATEAAEEQKERDNAMLQLQGKLSAAKSSVSKTGPLQQP